MDKAIDVRQLSRDERLELIEQLWDSLSDEECDSLPLTADQEHELDRRLDALEKRDRLASRRMNYVSRFDAGHREAAGLSA